MRSNLIHFDWAMKRLLRDKSNYVVLEGFLSTLLQEDIHICRFLESESNQSDASNKFNRADILVEDTKGELMIIETKITVNWITSIGCYTGCLKRSLNI